MTSPHPLTASPATNEKGNRDHKDAPLSRRAGGVPSGPRLGVRVDTPLLTVDNLTTVIHARRRTLRAVDRVSFTVNRGEILGLVGESGCGKSMTALSLMRLLPPGAAVAEGSVRFDGRDLLRLNGGEIRKVRGNDVSMVFQEPMTALDPAFTVGSQIAEVVRAHTKVGAEEARTRAVAMLDRLGIPNAARRIDDYPHQFSGGMRQRVMLALALVMNPKLLLADEPTTALDVTIQAQILDLIADLRRELGLSVILITHNLGVVNEIADRVAVMYAGEIVEIGTTRQIFENPQHPYTQGLLKSMPYLVSRQATLHVIPGRVPELWAMPAACRFAARCSNRIAPCVETHPDLARIETDHDLRCYNPTSFVR
ncbi:MAG: peptide/nickel transport system ATP-binding protein [Thermomicrobiales bacterium]|nr:peptide/nickel transport system ATP-binding protein [Thermomicrobiales bacterium]